MSRDHLIVGLVILALIAVGLADTVWKHRAFWRDYLAGVWTWCVTPVFAAPAGRHVGRNLPGPGMEARELIPGAFGQAPAESGPGQSDWEEPGENWVQELPAELERCVYCGRHTYRPGYGCDVCGTGEYPDDTLTGTAVIDYGTEPPPGSKVLLPVQDGYLPVRYEPPVDDAPAVDDTAFDMLPYQPHAGPAAWATARSQPYVSCRDLPQGWQWDGTTWVLFGGDTLPPQLRHDCTRPLLAIEAA